MLKLEKVVTDLGFGQHKVRPLWAEVTYYSKVVLLSKATWWKLLAARYVDFAVFLFAFHQWTIKKTDAVHPPVNLVSRAGARVGSGLGSAGIFRLIPAVQK